MSVMMLVKSTLRWGSATPGVIISLIEEGDLMRQLFPGLPATLDVCLGTPRSHGGLSQAPLGSVHSQRRFGRECFLVYEYWIFRLVHFLTARGRSIMESVEMAT